MVFKLEGFLGELNEQIYVELLLIKYWKIIRGCEEFKYLGVKIDEEDRQENYIKQD